MIEFEVLAIKAETNNVRVKDNKLGLFSFHILNLGLGLYMMSHNYITHRKM